MSVWPTWERPAEQQPAGALVLLHGRGGSEHDFSRLYEDLDPQHRLHVYVPRAPLQMGEGRAQWFDHEQRGSLEHAASAMHTWLDGLPFARDRVALAGWSQGGAMAYVLGLSARHRRPAAVVAFGAFLPVWEGWEAELDPPLPALAIAHGTNDASVPVAWARLARRVLLAADADLVYQETDVAHEIDPVWAPQAAALVARALRLGA
jgi:phospholipase/carboxylesterase